MFAAIAIYGFFSGDLGWTPGGFLQHSLLEALRTNALRPIF